MPSTTLETTPAIRNKGRLPNAAGHGRLAASLRKQCGSRADQCLHRVDPGLETVTTKANAQLDNMHKNKSLGV